MKITPNTIGSLVLGKTVWKSIIVAAQLSRAAASTLDQWDSVGVPVTDDFTSVAYQRGLYVAVTAQGDIFSSPTGSVWQHAFTPPEGLGSFDTIIAANGLFVAAGDSHKGNSRLYTSPDGRNWTARDSGIAGAIHGMAYGNGRYVGVAIGRRTIYSDDGATWKEGQRLNETGNAITFANGRFTIAGNRGEIYTSVDGANWTPRATPSPKNLNGIAWGNDLFVAAGDTGAILTSRDGIRWDDSLTRSLGAEDYYEVVFNAGVFIIVGENGFIAHSPNGKAWTVIPPKTDEILLDVVYSGRVFLAVGRNGATMRTPTYIGLPKPMITSGGRAFDVVAESGRSYTLDRSVDLKTWSSVGRITGEEGTTVRLIDTLPSRHAVYRLVMK